MQRAIAWGASYVAVVGLMVGVRLFAVTRVTASASAIVWAIAALIGIGFVYRQVFGDRPDLVRAGIWPWILGAAFVVAASVCCVFAILAALGFIFDPGQASNQGDAGTAVEWFSIMLALFVLLLQAARGGGAARNPLLYIIVAAVLLGLGALSLSRSAAQYIAAASPLTLILAGATGSLVVGLWLASAICGARQVHNTLIGGALLLASITVGGFCPPVTIVPFGAAGVMLLLATAWVAAGR